MANNLKDHLKEAADAIRAKKGTTDLINPQDFAEEIGAISGGGEEDGSNIEYLDVTENFTIIDFLIGGIEFAKVKAEGGNIPIEGFVMQGMGAFVMTQQLKDYGATITWQAVAYNPDTPVISKQNGVVTEQTAYDQIANGGEALIQDFNSLPRLTKEQFYSFD